MVMGPFTFHCRKAESWRPPAFRLAAGAGKKEERAALLPCTCISVRASTPPDLRVRYLRCDYMQRKNNK